VAFDVVRDDATTGAERTVGLLASVFAALAGCLSGSATLLDITVGCCGAGAGLGISTVFAGNVASLAALYAGGSGRLAGGIVLIFGEMPGCVK
jgi:hypothetical protein